LNTLSVLLPVHNAHHKLEASVSEILEVLPELTDHFELCILDDGSTDDTADTAHELAARYPQIRVIHHPSRLGLAESIRTGLDHTEGEVVFVGDEDYSLYPDDLRTLWQLRDTQRRLNGHAGLPPAVQEPWLEKLLAWKPRRDHSRGPREFQIIRRAAFEQFRQQRAPEIVARVDRSNRQAGSAAAMRPNFLDKVKRFAWGE
jgi:glycosyltransferase involved in cell wall biosynthesis